MVMQLPMNFLVGEPRYSKYAAAAAAAAKSGPTRIRTADIDCCGLLCYHQLSILLYFQGTWHHGAVGAYAVLCFEFPSTQCRVVY